MDSIFRGRHIGYTSTGKPVASRMPEPTCADALFTTDTALAARHVGYTAAGVPRAFYTFSCCFLANNNCRVQTACLAPQASGGVTDTMLLYVYNVSQCLTAQQRVVLTYSGPGCATAGGGDFGTLSGGGGCGGSGCGTPCCGGKWSGTIGLRGGSLPVEICCHKYLDGFSNPHTSFLLHYGPCSGAGGTDPEGCIVKPDPDCYDPLRVDFGQISLPNCCDCTNTDQNATIQIIAVANCRSVYWGRHAGYTAAGVPVALVADKCGGIPQPSCSEIACGLHLAVTNVSGCLCLAGSTDMPHGVANNWIGTINSCSAPASFTLTCTPAGVDADGDPVSQLCLVVTCGATNTGSACIIVKNKDLDTLDETFVITMTDPNAGGVCTGNCSYRWNAMTVTWEPNGDTCDGTACGSCCDPCPNGPTDGSPGSVDGQVRTQPCTGGYTVPCCIGTISCRITR